MGRVWHCTVAAAGLRATLAGAVPQRPLRALLQQSSSPLLLLQSTDTVTVPPWPAQRRRGAPLRPFRAQSSSLNGQVLHSWRRSLALHCSASCITRQCCASKALERKGHGCAAASFCCGGSQRKQSSHSCRLK